MISQCTCSNEYQDEKYGYKNRVWNRMKKPGMYRCTNCLKESQLAKAEDEAKKDKEKWKLNDIYFGILVLE